MSDLSSRAPLDYAREHAGDVIVIWKLDRLARSLSQLIETADLLEKRGIGLKSLTEVIDTTSTGSRLVFHIFGAMAEFERSIIRERTRADLDAARTRGRTGGRPPALAAKDVALAKAMLRDPDITMNEVAKQLKVAPSTLYRICPADAAAWQKDRARCTPIAAHALKCPKPKRCGPPWQPSFSLA